MKQKETTPMPGVSSIGDQYCITAETVLLFNHRQFNQCVFAGSPGWDVEHHLAALTSSPISLNCPII